MYLHEISETEVIVLYFIDFWNYDELYDECILSVKSRTPDISFSSQKSYASLHT